MVRRLDYLLSICCSCNHASPELSIPIGNFIFPNTASMRAHTSLGTRSRAFYDGILAANSFISSDINGSNASEPALNDASQVTRGQVRNNADATSRAGSIAVLLLVLFITTLYGSPQGSDSTAAQSCLQDSSCVFRMAILSSFLASIQAEHVSSLEQQFLFLTARWYRLRAAQLAFRSVEISSDHQFTAFLPRRVERLGMQLLHSYIKILLGASAIDSMLGSRGSGTSCGKLVKCFWKASTFIFLKNQPRAAIGFTCVLAAPLLTSKII